MASKKITQRQKAAAKKNIGKAQTKWKSMTKRQHTLAQPQGRSRVKHGVTGKGKFYRIELRPKGEFKSFRVQDVGKKGGLERLAGKRGSGSWDTVSWLVSKMDARMTADKKLVITGVKAKSVLKQISGHIHHLKGDIFIAHPKNVPERMKPTMAQRRAQKTNIKKAQNARRK